MFSLCDVGPAGRMHPWDGAGPEFSTSSPEIRHETDSWPCECRIVLADETGRADRHGHRGMVQPASTTVCHLEGDREGGDVTAIDEGTAYGMPAPESDPTLVEVEAGTPAGELLRRYWHPIAAVLADVEDKTRLKVRLLGEDLILYRDGKGGAPTVSSSRSAPTAA